MIEQPITIDNIGKDLPMKDVVIIGGGASGIFASIVLKSKAGSNVNVTVVDRLEKVGRKLLATGSGRCNFTNQFLDPKKYNEPTFVKHLFKQFGFNETIDYFTECGLLSKISDEGRVYPASELATSMLDVLRLEMRRLGVIEKCNFEVKRINPEGNGYLIESVRSGTITADYVIVATGGKADSVLGSNGSGYALLKPYKVETTDILPGLVGIKQDESIIKGLDGVRSKAEITLINKKDKKVLWREAGEIIFKKDGMSGIVIMQMATQIARNSVKKTIPNANYLYKVDLLSEYSEEALCQLFDDKIKRLCDMTNDNLLTGVFHKMINLNLLKRSKIEPTGYMNTLTKRDINRLVSNIKELTFDAKDTYDFDKAQVTVGGIDLEEVRKETLELKKAPRMYVCGEILNVDGECGGYNLQWAWTSGFVVASAIASKINRVTGGKDGN